jgi:hypothetical protein
METDELPNKSKGIYTLETIKIVFGLTRSICSAKSLKEAKAICESIEKLLDNADIEDTDGDGNNFAFRNWYEYFLFLIQWIYPHLSKEKREQLIMDFLKSLGKNNLANLNDKDILEIIKILKSGQSLSILTENDQRFSFASKARKSSPIYSAIKKVITKPFSLLFNMFSSDPTKHLAFSEKKSQNQKNKPETKQSEKVKNTMVGGKGKIEQKENIVKGEIFVKAGNNIKSDMHGNVANRNINIDNNNGIISTPTQKIGKTDEQNEKILTNKNEEHRPIPKQMQKNESLMEEQAKKEELKKQIQQSSKTKSNEELEKLRELAERELELKKQRDLNKKSGENPEQKSERQIDKLVQLNNKNKIMDICLNDKVSTTNDNDDELYSVDMEIIDRKTERKKEELVNEHTIQYSTEQEKNIPTPSVQPVSTREPKEEQPKEEQPKEEQSRMQILDLLEKANTKVTPHQEEGNGVKSTPLQEDKDNSNPTPSPKRNAARGVGL